MADDHLLVERLRRGDEEAFAELVERYHMRLIRFARSMLSSQQAAEDVVQDTWIAVIRGVDRFEGRSSLQTWLFRICANRARSRLSADSRTVAVGVAGESPDGSWFDRSGRWAEPVQPWSDVDDRLSAEMMAPVARVAIEELPDLQRQVVTLRDIEGLSSEDICEVLSISDANLRVVLHRARARVRAVLDARIRSGER